MPQSNKRDDFSQKTKSLVAQRAGFVCSRPVCQRATSGPTQQPTGAMNLGVAAHITAASVNGPRYDSSLTPDERSHSSNAIWLCQTCAKLVDSDTAKFTVSVLNDWKATAEHFAMQRAQGLLGDSTRAIQIDFDASEWTTHVESGSYSDGQIFVVSFYAPGDLVYNCEISFRNQTTEQQILTDCKVEFRNGNCVLASCDACRTNVSPVKLAPKEWKVVHAQNAIEPKSALRTAVSVWFKANLLGSDDNYEWKMTDLPVAATT